MTGRILAALSALLITIAMAHSQPAEAIFRSAFEQGTSGFSVQWTGSGDLQTARQPGHVGPSGAPSLETTCQGPAKGSVGVSIAVGEDRIWRIRLHAGSELAQGSASVALQCWNGKNEQVAWISCGGLPSGRDLKPLTSVVSIPADCTHLNLLVLHEDAVGVTWMADVTVDPFGAEIPRPAGPTRWGATSFVNGYDDRAVDATVKLLVAAGITNTRGWVDWRTAEPQRGEYDFSGLERQLSLADEYGYEVAVVCIHGTPGWASGKSAPADMLPDRKARGRFYMDRAFWAPADWSDWERFVRALTSRFKGRVAAWEIMNEPDLWTEGFNGSYDDYCNYLRIASGTVRQDDPECRVLTAAFVFGDWLPRLLADGLHEYFDGVCVHPYGGKPGDCVARASKTRLTLMASGADRELWITETGFQSGGWKEGPGVVDSEQTKAAYGGQALSELSELASLVTWYTAIEKGDMYGLLRQDDDRYVPMPIYYEYGDLTGRLPREGGPITVQVTVPNTAFREQSGQIVLQATNTGDQPLPVKLWPVGLVTNLGPAGELRCHDWEGVLAAGESRTITVPITPKVEAKGEYLVGLAALTESGNSVALKPLGITPE